MSIEAELADGRILEFPDGTDPQVIQATIKRMLAGNSAKSGFRPAIAAGFENLKGDLAGLAGRTGLMPIADAEAQQARNKAAAVAAHTPTTDTWLDSPWLKFKETLGGSLPYMAAPLAAGAAGAVAAPALPAVALGAAGLTSAAQFTGSNLTRQQVEGKKLADTDLAAAGAVAVPQALLDMVGFKMIPGIRRIFQAAGKELTPQAAAAIAKKGVQSVLADYAKAGVKASGVEGVTEAGQQVFERLQAGLALDDAAAREEYLQSFIGGAALGGALAVPGRFHERGREQMQAADIDAAKQAKAEADAAVLQQQEEEQKNVQRQDPAYAAQVADRYQKAEAAYRSMLPGKLGADADQADIAEHAAQKKAAEEFLKNELEPLIPEYLAVKPTLKAQQDAAFKAAGQPAMPEAEETNLLFPLQPTTLQPPGPAIPTADEVEAQRAKLADQQQALNVHMDSLREQTAEAAQAGDTQEALRLAKQFTEARDAANRVSTQTEQLPKAPKHADLAKQLEKAKIALAKAGEERDVDAIERHANRIEKLKAAGAELMQPGPAMPEVPAGGKSESADSFYGRIATGDTAGADTPQLPYNPARAAFEAATRRDKDFPQAQQQFDANRRTEAQETRTGQEIAQMGANRLDTTQTAQGDLFQAPEAQNKVQQGTGAVSAKSRAQLVADLQIARAAQNAVPGKRSPGDTQAVRDALEGLRDLRAREEAAAAAAAAKGPDVSNLAGSQLSTALAGTRMPGSVAKQQAAADARHRAYGNLVSILNRFNKGLAKQDELDRARQQVLVNLVDEIDAARDTPLTAVEAAAVRKQAEPLLNDLQSRFGDTRDVVEVQTGTRKRPSSYTYPAQRPTGEYTQAGQPGPNVEDKGPGSRTFASPMAAAKSIQEGLDKIRADAVNGEPGTQPAVGVPTARETTLEALQETVARAETSPLLERLKANLPAFVADPARRALAADWLHKQSIGLDNELGAKVTAELDRLETGKRSETEGDRTAVQGDMLPDTELQGTLFATKEEFDEYLASDALQALRSAAKPVMETLSRIHRQLAPVEKRIASLRASLVAVQTRRARAESQKGVDAAQALARYTAAEKKLEALIRDTLATKLEPLRAEVEVARQVLAQTYQDIADIEARIAENHHAFYGQFSNDKYVAAAMDTLAKAREKHIALINEPNAVENVKNGIFNTAPVIKAGERVNEALLDALQALQRAPDSRKVLAFLNKDLELQLELQAGQTQLSDAQNNLREATQRLTVTAPKTVEGNVRRSPQGAELQTEMTAAKKQAATVAARDKKLRTMADAIVKLGIELDDATQELETALKPAVDRAKDRTNPNKAPGPHSEIDAGQRAENAQLERMANTPGELITFTDMQLVADKFAALPERVAALEEKAADVELPVTTRAKAKDQASRARWKMNNLQGLLADDVAINAQAREAALAQMEKVKTKIGKKRIAVNEDGISDSTQRSRAKELARLQTELRDLQRFVAEFDQKVTRTPKETSAQRSERLQGDTFVENPIEASQDLLEEAQALEAVAADEEATPGARRAAAQRAKLLRTGRLPAQKRGPVVKSTVVAGNIRTGEASTAGERKLSSQNKITQAGARRPVTSKQAQRAAAKDVAYEQAMLRMSKLETKLEETETKLEDATDPEVVANLTQFQARVEQAIRATQKSIDGTATGKRKVKADVVTDDYVNEGAETATMFLPDMRDQERLTEDEQVRKFGAALFRTATNTGPGLKSAEVTRLADRVIEGWTNVPQITVVETEAALPQKLQDQAAAEDMTGKVPGVFDPDTQTVYLVASNLHNGNDVALTLAHEVAGHYGLRDMMGTEYTPTMNRLHNGNSTVRAAADAKMKATPSMSKEVAVEETLADMAEKGDPSALKQVWQAIKQWLAKKLGIRGVSDAEVQQIVANARRHVQDGTPGPKGNGPGGPAVFRTSPYAIGNAIAQKKSFKERYAANATLAAEMWGVDQRAPLEQALAKGDKKAAMQTMYYVRKNDARMDQVNSVFTYGALGVRKDAKGNFVVEAGHSKSVNDVFKAIQKLPGANAQEKMEKAQVYLTALRAQADPTAEFALQLGKITPAQIAADLAKLTVEPKQKAALEEVRRVYADLNRGLVQFLEDTGALSKAESALYMKSDSYVPFYRVRGDGIAELVFDETKVIRLGDIRTQPYLKQLEGGDTKLLPLNESITRNVMLLTDMGMRNLTTKNVAYALQTIGKPAKKMAIHSGKAPANVRALVFKQDGGEYYSLVDTEGTAVEGIPSEMLARSVEGSYTVLPAGMKMFGWFGDVLRSGVTRNPMYVGRQLFRDPLAASFTGGLDRGPLTAVAKAMADFVHQSASGPTKTAEALIRKGVVNSGIHTGDPDDLSKISMQLAGNDAGAIRKILNLADRAAMRADAVTRQQLYDDVLKRTGSEMEAELAAREMMNFHKRGLSPTVQYASRLIPFFNAQIQGLNVLYKAATGKATMQERLAIKQKFYDRAGLLMMSTFLYALAMEDDDTYKNAQANMRYNNWFVPLHRDDVDPSKDVTVRLPIPFEVGLIFKAVPEALIDFTRGKSTVQEWKAIRSLFLNQIPGGSAFLIPQAVKPLIEIATNHSFFTGRDIEGPGMQGVDPMERYTARATELSKRMSETLQTDMTPDFLKLSPVQIEHLARGFLGSLPLIAAALVNEVFSNGSKSQPERKASETPMFGALFQDRYGGGATDILYAKIKAADQVQATVNKMKNEGRKQDAKAYLQNVENLWEMKHMQQAENELQELSRKEKAVRSNETATAERKRELLNTIAAKREKISRRYLDAVSAVAQ